MENTMVKNSLKVFEASFQHQNTSFWLKEYTQLSLFSSFGSFEELDKVANPFHLWGGLRDEAEWFEFEYSNIGV